MLFTNYPKQNFLSKTGKQTNKTDHNTTPCKTTVHFLKVEIACIALTVNSDRGRLNWEHFFFGSVSQILNANVGGFFVFNLTYILLWVGSVPQEPEPKLLGCNIHEVQFSLSPAILYSQCNANVTPAA